ncbi:MAG TPA: hypothetical protein VL522_12545 [Bordetella sp.]|nr:hypothetical protein [Bordetella sp.]
MVTPLTAVSPDSVRGYITRFDVSAKDGPISARITFTIVNEDAEEIVGAMYFDASSVAADSYAIIFTMAMVNAYEVIVRRKQGDSLYSSVQLLLPDGTSTPPEDD